MPDKRKRNATQMSVSISGPSHVRLQAYCASKGISMSEWVTRRLEEAISKAEKVDIEVVETDIGVVSQTGENDESL